MSPDTFPFRPDRQHPAQPHRPISTEINRNQPNPFQSRHRGHDSMTTATVTDMLNLFELRCEHCRMLLELSRQQRELIDAGDFTKLVLVLGQKQRILGRLDESNNQFSDIRRQWPQVRSSADPALRAKCDERLKATEMLLATLLREEQESTERLIRRRDATQRQLQAIAQGTEVHHAYRESLAPVTHRHLNVDQ